MTFQTTVSIFIVLGQDRVRDLFDDGTIEVWFSAYIDLLSRFRLLNTATEVKVENFYYLNER